MAAGDDSGGSWWGSWLQVAKEKSATALEMVKKDLAEFTCTMQADTSSAVVTTSDKLKETLKTENTSAAKDRVKNSLTSFLEGLSKALVIEAEDKDVPIKPREQHDAVYDRAKARLHAIQIDPGTYYNEPSGSQELFKTWEQSFDIEAYKGDISELLVSKVEVRTFYTKLVPGEMSHADFWKRYFYKVHQLQQDEARKLALMKRAEQAQKREDSIGWEDDWSGDEESADSRGISVGRKVSDNSSEAKRSSLEERLSPLVDSDSESSKATVGGTMCDNSSTSDKTKDIDNESKNTEQESKVSVDSAEKQDVKPLDAMSEEKDEIQIMGETINTEAIDTICDKTDIPDPVEKTDIETDREESAQKDESKSKAKIIDNKNDKEINNKNVVDECSSKDKKDNVEVETHIKTKDKGDVVVVNPDRDTPSSESSGNKENSLDDDWEQDFDVELTEEDMKAADEIAKKLNISATDYTKLAGELFFSLENKNEMATMEEAIVQRGRFFRKRDDELKTKEQQRFEYQHIYNSLFPFTL